MTNQIIGLCGLIGSGKDTVAKYLIDNHGFKKFSFATKLKDIVSILFHWDRKLLEGDSEISRAFRETEDTWWTSKLEIINKHDDSIIPITPRYILQYFGTGLFRKHFCDDIWIFSLEKELHKYKNEKIIITDCRFNNELIMLHKLNASIYQVNRLKEFPDWYHLARVLNTDNDIDLSVSIKNYLLYLNIHPSEYSWIGNKYIKNSIDNFSTLDNLYKEIELKIIQKNKN